MHVYPSAPTEPSGWVNKTIYAPVSPMNLNNSEMPRVQISMPSKAYKYNEPQTVQEIASYLAATYGEHYAGDSGIQAFDVWEALDGDPSPSHRNTAIKYLYRYGKKGGHNRKDLLKAMHYIVLLLHYHTKHHSKETCTNHTPTSSDGQN